MYRVTGLIENAALGEGPAAETLAAAWEHAFAGGDLLTLGLEEELILVDPVSFEPADEIEGVLELAPDGKFQAEFRASQIELVMPVSLSPAGLGSELAFARARSSELSGSRQAGRRGHHPSSTRPIQVTDRPRYRRIADECSWGVGRGIPSGLHVHVGIGDAEEALADLQRGRRLPARARCALRQLAILRGADSGSPRSRLKLVEDMPRSGIPPAFASWHELAGFVSWGRPRGSSPISPISGGPPAAAGSWDDRVQGRRRPDLDRAQRSARGDLPVARRDAPAASSGR